MNKQEVVKSAVESLNRTASDLVKAGMVRAYGGKDVGFSGKEVSLTPIGDAFRDIADALEALAAEPDPKPSAQRPTVFQEHHSGQDPPKCCACGGKYQYGVICVFPEIPFAECVCGVRWENGRLVRGPKVDDTVTKLVANEMPREVKALALADIDYAAEFLTAARAWAVQGDRQKTAVALRRVWDILSSMAIIEQKK